MIKLDRVSAGYRTTNGFVGVVDDVSLTIADSEILGIAGESGCGKSTLIKVIYGQFDGTLALISGSVEGRFCDDATGEMVSTSANHLSDLWWKQISYIPQGSMSLLNPVTRIRAQMMDSLPDAMRSTARATAARAFEKFLAEMDLPSSVLNAYPHQLSGGMRQRVLVAMAAFFKPKLIIADEPTTALDVVIQKKILLLLVEIQRRQRNAIVIVSHDLGVHYQITHRLAITYAGKIVEIGPTQDIFAAPRHPYTRALIGALPILGDRTPRFGIAGQPPDLSRPEPGCRFASRCTNVGDICLQVSPNLIERTEGHSVACHFA